MEYGVVTICYNSGKTVARTIESVLSQGRSPAEYYFVDGGSTDDTRAVIQSTMQSGGGTARNCAWELIDQGGRRGIADAWNLGIARIKADVVFLLNSDDWYDPQCAELVMSAFERHADAEMVIGTTRMYRDGSDEEGRVYSNKSFHLFPFLNPINHPACFVKKNVYDAIGEYSRDYKVASDYDFLYRCFKNGITIVEEPNIIVNRLDGGFAVQNKVVSRSELRRIAKRYCSTPFLPEIAYCARKILGR